ncbi:MAG: hypothetical protein ACOC80_11300 [Petrotogales bacterium]
MKKILTFGIVLLFIVSVVSPIAIGYNAICRDDDAFYSCVEDDSLGYNYGEEQHHRTISNSTDEEEISYYDPDTLRVFGLQYPPKIPIYWDSAVRFTLEELDPYPGWDLIKVIVALSYDNYQSEIYANLTIYGEGTPTMPGSILYEEHELYFDATNWYTIELNTTIPLDDHDEIWIAMTWKQTEDPAYIPFVDGGPAVDGKGDWVRIDNGEWEELQTYGLDFNWGMGGIVEGEGGVAELAIQNVKGPIGVKADVKNIGNETAYNVEWSMSVTGGILGMVNMSNSGTETELAAGETKPISSGLIFGLGPITINITADAATAFEVSTTKTGFILGPFVFVII